MATTAREKLQVAWQQARTDRTRLVEYLKSHGLSEDVLARVPDDVIRYHSALPYFDSEGNHRGDFPAMVARVTDVSGNLVTIQRTYLDPDGSGKLDLGEDEPAKKLMTPTKEGATKGASIRLAPAGSVLGVAEGIETALAVMEATGLPCWSCMSAGGLEAIILPPEVEAVHVWADNDSSGRGQQAAARLAERLHSQGQTVYLHLPQQASTDWLDVHVRQDAGVVMDELTTCLPWRPQAVLAEILDGLVSTLRRYVVFALPEQPTAVALWIAHTHVFEQFDTSPYMALLSPEKRCGKTRMFDCAEHYVAQPWRATLPSEAVLFRKIDQERPTLLLDEVDTIFGPKASPTYEPLRALLNAGHRRGTTVPRCVGEGARMAVHDFAVYCPKAFAGIGRALPDTVLDRSIVINMVRKMPGEEVERFRYREAQAEAAPLQSALAQWAAKADLSQARPDLPDELDDRAQDCWEPLFALADMAGGEWPEIARRAAVVLSGANVKETTSVGIRLLTDCREAFAGDERITSAGLVERLRALDEAPWGDQERPLNARRLAQVLKPYGVRPGDHRFDAGTFKGYLRADFEDAWRRYLPGPLPKTIAQGQQGQHSCKTRQNKGQQTQLKTQHVAHENLPICRHVADVADETPFPRSDDEVVPLPEAWTARV